MIVDNKRKNKSQRRPLKKKQNNQQQKVVKNKQRQKNKKSRVKRKKAVHLRIQKKLSQNQNDLLNYDNSIRLIIFQLLIISSLINTYSYKKLVDV